MLRFLSIRSRISFLLALLVASLVLTNLLLINQVRNQEQLISQQQHIINAIVMVDAAVKTFGDLKYWLADLVLGQSPLAQQRAKGVRARLEEQLSAVESDMPDAVAGVPDQVSELMGTAMVAVEAYGRDDRLVGNSMVARSRAHILAVDAKLSVLVAQLRERAQDTIGAALRQSEQDIRTALWAVALVTLAAAALAFLIARSVVTPLRQMVTVIRSMTAGRMGVPIPPAARDEIGDMAKVLGLFRDSVARREQAEQALREKTEFLHLNQVITRAANEAASVEAAMQIALDQVCAHTGWPVGHAYLLDEAAGELAPSGIWHLDDAEAFETFRSVTEATRFAAGAGLPGRVLASGHPAWIFDVT